jgi:hypothetical protein
MTTIMEIWTTIRNKSRIAVSLNVRWFKVFPFLMFSFSDYKRVISNYLRIRFSFNLGFPETTCGSFTVSCFKIKNRHRLRDRLIEPVRLGHYSRLLAVRETKLKKKSRVFSEKCFSYSSMKCFWYFCVWFGALFSCDLHIGGDVGEGNENLRSNCFT